MKVATPRYHVAATVEVVTHSAPYPDQIAVMVIDVAGYRATAARAPKIAMTQSGPPVSVKIVSPVTARLTMMPAKPVTAICPSVPYVITRANVNADTGMNRFCAYGRRYRQSDGDQAGHHRQTLD